MDHGEATRSILAAYEAGELITMCAWCQRITMDREQWVLAPRAALTAIDAPRTLSHSICPSCQTQEHAAAGHLTASVNPR
ncbi:MAG: hypothetical protein QOF43_2177 [Gaiellaceae bacterium]|jgi:hypothetical protein|nr:hypothetical protein [Gaiellaceae bacterium]